MIHLLDPKGLSALQAFITPTTLFAFDLDGTLAPIVDKPDKIRIPEQIRESMERLSSVAATAVITGRSASDAGKRLGFNPAYLVGNHGIEGIPGENSGLEEIEQMVLLWKRQIEENITPELLSSIFIEMKGASMSLHFRNATDPENTHNVLLAAIEKLNPAPRHLGGKFVINLIPEGAPDKGKALLGLMKHAGTGTSFFMGDDIPDEDVFKLQDQGIFSVCIGLERKSAAIYYLDSQSETAALLQEIIRLTENIRQKGTAP